MDYYELIQKEKESLARARDPNLQAQDDFSIDTDTTLKKDDLLNYQYLNPIRDYMVERKGVDYKEKSDAEVVDDFVQHMRYFNANSVITAGEVRFITKADDQRKAKAKKAYQIYEQLGNVFQNDGLYGAVDGIKDYVFAAAKDPTNYIGLATGGIGRAGAAGVSITGKQVIKEAVRKAGMEAAQGGAGRAAAKAAGERAGKEAAARAVLRDISKKQSDIISARVADKVSKEARKGLAEEAMKKKQNELFTAASKRALKQTVAFDAGLAAFQDVMAQETYIRAGAQEEYSKLQLALSPLLGGVAGAAQLGFGKFRGASGFEDTGSSLEKISNNIIEEYSPVLEEADTKEVSKYIKNTVKDWNTKVEDGKNNSRVNMPSELIKEILLGADGKGGLAKIFKDKGFKLRRNQTVSDAITNVVRYIPEQELADINKEMVKYTGLSIGELSENTTQLGDFLAKDISQAGSTLNVASQLRKTLDAGLVTVSNGVLKTVEEEASEAVLEKELKKAAKSEPFKYGQSVWKRLLVSSPATTAINVAGFSQYYAGSALADLFGSATLMTKSLAQQAIDPAAARESRRQAHVLVKMQAQKIRNFLDPYTTYDAYMRILDENKDARKALFETMSGGIEVNAERFGINPDNMLYKNLEAYANAAGKMTGVRIQDSVTKSQMFMNELDKYLQLKTKKSLKETLMDGDAIDELSIQGALDGTLKSVFAKDYTKGDQPELIRSLAKAVESVSNTPVLGTVIPFGRFFNNVLATTYQWSPLAFPEKFIKFSKNLFKNEPDATVNDAFARMMVGSTALYMAMDYDTERQKKGLSVYEVETGSGTIIDAKNTFPFSVFLAAGRVLNNMRNGVPNPPELQQEIGTQLMVGQLARDAQFANDINNMIDVITNTDEGARAMAVDGFYKVAGNFAAGFTRPFDAFNKIFGFAAGTDSAKDIRQADGLNVFTQTSSRYIDNILESFIDAAEVVTDKDLDLGDKSLTGEELRVATREGEIYDANPFARIFGLTIKPGRTATEKAYSMAEMFPWQASERTKIPAYDKALNSFLAPVLEKQTDRLIRTDEFKNATLSGKRKMLKNVLSEVKAGIRKKIDKGYLGSDTKLLNMARKASTKSSKEIRTEAMALMEKHHGITGKLEDLSYNELDIFTRYVDYLDDIYDASKLI